MFSFFRKKEKGIRVTDKVLMKEPAKFKVLLSYAIENPNTIFLGWFDDTIERLTSFFREQQCEASVEFPRSVMSVTIKERPVVFIEHYPLADKEKETYERLGLDEVTVYSSLDEPFFRRFGSDRITALMEQLGMKEDELIEHKMITASIHQAQEKIASKVSIDHTAASQQDWLEKNLPAG